MSRTNQTPFVLIGKGPTFGLIRREIDALRARDAEIWAINDAGRWCQPMVDVLIHMDDVSHFDQILPDFGVWLRDECPHRVVTCRPYNDRCTAYPYEQVEQAFAHDPFLACSWNRNTMTYALALAIWEGRSEIHLFGCDHKDGKGDMWMSVAMGAMVAHAIGLGITVHQPDATPYIYEAKPYGYQTPPDPDLERRIVRRHREYLAGPHDDDPTQPVVAAELARIRREETLKFLTEREAA